MRRLSCSLEDELIVCARSGRNDVRPTTDHKNDAMATYLLQGIDRWARRVGEILKIHLHFILSVLITEYDGVTRKESLLTRNGKLFVSVCTNGADIIFTV